MLTGTDSTRGDIMKGKYRMIEDGKDAVVLQNTVNGMYYVMEFFDSDIICMTNDSEHAKQVRDGYDFYDITEERRKSFRELLERMLE